MVSDKRNSRSPVSDYSLIPSGDGDDTQIVDLRESETFAPDYVKVEYSAGATANTMVTLTDQSNDEGDFGADSPFEAFLLAPGDDVIITEASYDDIQNGVTAATDGNNDGDIVVTVGGMKITG